MKAPVLLIGLFTTTSFLGAALLFLVEPMFAKMVLPFWGGTPAVWNTCVLFFQATLLLGYGYVHATRRMRPSHQAALHGALLVLPLFFLPVSAVATGYHPEKSPVVTLLGILAVGVGAPFLAVSTTTPILQAWLARTRHPQARDPYFLYSASNMGSMLALIAYPVSVESGFPLEAQGRLWAWGYGAWVVLKISCGLALWRSQGLGSENPEGETRRAEPAAGNGSAEPAKSPRQRRLAWLALAFVPSSWMLGVTTYLTMDVASVPLLWILPLAIYLLTFIIVFAPRPLLPHSWAVRLFPFVMLLLAISVLTDQPSRLLPVHVAVFFAGSMLCHGELARLRPAPTFLTEYYLIVSLGGLLGGVFNALLAPALFPTLIEYPLTILAACLLAPALRVDTDNPRSRWIDLACLGGLFLLAALILKDFQPVRTKILFATILCFVPLSILFYLANRPRLFTCGIAAILAADLFEPDLSDQTLRTARSFFGCYRVTADAKGHYHYLAHGTTMHGCQATEAARRCEPLAYYHRTGPLGRVFESFRGQGTKTRIAAIGLGAGAMIAYAEPGQEFTFFEIDPAVQDIAENPKLFTYLSHCGNGRYQIVIGDGRIQLAQAPNNSYDMIVLDAFSSGAIAVHLMTREALSLYLSKLADGGILVFHISNNLLDLEPVFGDLARDAGLAALACHDTQISPEDLASGKLSSSYAVMARHQADLKGLAESGAWRKIRRAKSDPWTDDFSSILSAFR